MKPTRTSSLLLHDHDKGRLYTAPKSAHFQASSLQEARALCGLDAMPKDPSKASRKYYLTVVDPDNPDAVPALDAPVHGSQAAVATLLGVSQATISNALRTGKPVNGVLVTDTDPTDAPDGVTPVADPSGTVYYLLIEDPDKVPDLHAVQDYPCHTSQQAVADILDTSQQAVSRAIREGSLLNGVFITTDPSAAYEGE